MKAGETAKIDIVMGETGSVEITASEKEGGKWVKAYHYTYKIIEGEVDDTYLTGCWSQKKKECVEQLPVGQYLMKSTFNKFKKDTPFEIKSGEVTKLQIAMGQTGKAEISASEKVGSKWVKAYHYFYKEVDGEMDDTYTAGCWSNKKKECLEQIPAGSYLVKSSFKTFKKETSLEISAGEVSKLHVTFAQFFIDAKCTDMNAVIKYEIYASNGRMVFEKQGKCSDQIKVPIDDGDYTVEAKINDDAKEVQFSVGGDHPSSLTIDMQTANKESVHEKLIKADTQENSNIEAPQEKTTPVQPTDKSQESIPDSSSIPEMNEMAKALAQAGAIFGGLQKLQNQPLQTFKGDILSLLPIIKKVKTCYQEASDLDQAGTCETMEEEVAQKLPVKILPALEKNTEWNEETKQASIKRAERYIKDMGVSLTCIDKGANLSQMKDCIDNDGAFTAKKSELGQMGDLFKALGNMKQ